MSDQGFAHVFEPLQVKGMRLRNRLVAAPIHTGYATPEGFVTSALLKYHAAVSRHVGMDVVELACVKKEGGSSSIDLGIYDDLLIPGLAKLADAIKSNGAAAVIQLVDFGARRGLRVKEAELIGPSEIPAGALAQRGSREMTINEINDFVVSFAAGARRAFEAGFDSVEVHAAHMYLISQFLSGFTNRRNDDYGGSVKNRARFLLDIIRAIKEELPGNFPVICRINGTETYDDGITIEEAQEISKLIVDAGCDIISLSRVMRKQQISNSTGQQYQWPTSTPAKNSEPGSYAWMGEALKRAVDIPIVIVGKIWSLALAEKILSERKADLIAIGRALIADPDMVIKEVEGRTMEIQHCKEDLLCLTTGTGGEPMRCAVNKALPPEGITERI